MEKQTIGLAFDWVRDRELFTSTTIVAVCDAELEALLKHRIARFCSREVRYERVKRCCRRKLLLLLPLLSISITVLLTRSPVILDPACVSREGRKALRVATV